MKPQMVTMRYPLLRTIELDWTLDWRNVSSGRAADGSNQIVGMGFPRWIGAPTLRLPPSFIGEYNAMRDSMKGLANVWRVPMTDPVTLDREVLLRTRKKTLPFGLDAGSGPLFSSGVGFQWDPILIAPDGAKKGATSIRLTGDYLAVGQISSYEDWPFRILSLLDDPAGGKRATVAPAIRSNIPAGGIIQAIGHGLFQLEDAGTGQIAYDLIRVSNAQISFVEWINR